MSWRVILIGLCLNLYNKLKKQIIGQKNKNKQTIFWVEMDTGNGNIHIIQMLKFQIQILIMGVEEVQIQIMGVEEIQIQIMEEIQVTHIMP